jgi:DegV family protein with EDD domain
MGRERIRFVTDSTADLPPDIVNQWNIGVVPAFVNYGGNSYADDGVELRRGDYYAQMAEMPELPTTAAPSAGIAARVINETFEDADHLFILTLPAKLSGIYNAMRLGASELPPQRVTLIDSGQVSIALGWQVIVGVEVAEETGDVQKVKEAIRRVRAHQGLFATLNTMEYLRRSGRVGWAAASIGELLQIKPILKVVDGEVISIARVRTFGRAIQKLESLTREMAPLDRAAIAHANNLDAAHDLRDRLADILPEDTPIMLVNPALGTHTGPGVIGIAPLSKKWRQ